MTELLFETHRGVGYLVALIVLVAAVLAFRRAGSGREFDAGLYRLAMGLLSLQVLIGLVLYGVGGYWDARPLIAYLHPLVAIAALGVGQVLVGRARKQQQAADAHRAAGRGLAIALVLVLVAIALSSLPG